MNKVPLLRAKGIFKSFGPVEVLKGVDFKVNYSEIVGLVGDNGAGKTTLVKILSGAYNADRGRILFEEKEVNFLTPRDSRKIGIEMMYQDMEVIDCLEVWENIFLGKLLLKNHLRGLIKTVDKRKMKMESRTQLERIGLNINSMNIPVANLSGGQRKGIAILRAVYWKAKLIIMDEPTAALGVSEVNKVLQLIRELKERGISVIFISHNLQEIFSVVDRIVVLCKARVSGVKKTEETTPEEIIKSMVKW